VEDTGAVTLTMDHGAVGSLFFSDAAPSPWSYEFTTVENKKYPPVPGEGHKDCYHFMGAQQSLAFPSLRMYGYPADTEVPGWDSPLALWESEAERVDPIQVQMSHFVRVCRQQEEPVCSGMDAVQSLAVICAVHRSAETGLPTRPGDLLAEASGQNFGLERCLHLSKVDQTSGSDEKSTAPGTVEEQLAPDDSLRCLPTSYTGVVVDESCADEGMGAVGV
jgi:hypothetical protein